jgi:threonine dehydratase
MMTITGSVISRERIKEVEGLIRPYIRRTPVIEVKGADFGLADATLSFKLELFQHSGAFKTRGAFANLVTRYVPRAGVVAASGGNHGAAVAYAAMRLEKPAKIFIPRTASRAKAERIRGYGAELVEKGEEYADALAASVEWVAQSGALPVHAYDQLETILGQGTIGTELEEQAGRLDTLLVAVGGGGLISGLASWYEGRVKIIGVEPEGAPTLKRAFEAGGPVDVEVKGIAADSLGARRVGELVYPIARRYVEQVVLVSDDAIREAQKTLWDVLRVVAEPGGAATFAALSSGQYKPRPGERVGLVVSGGNTTAVDFDLQAPSVPGK